MDLTSTGFSLQAVPQANAFRPIYYLGCKTSFASAITAAIDDVDPTGGRLIDLFSGTGSVAAAVGSTREVTTVDIQEYSRVLCSAVLMPAALSKTAIHRIATDIANSDIAREVIECLHPLIEHETFSIHAAMRGDDAELIEFLEAPSLVAAEDTEVEASSARLNAARQQTIDRLRTAGLWRSVDTTVSRNFGGVYFSFRQTAMLDAAMTIAERSDTTIRETLKAAALSTASSIVNTVGKQFAQPIQPRNKSGLVKAGLVKTVHRDRSLDVAGIYEMWLQKYAALPRAIGQPHALRQDYLGALQRKGDGFSVVYADPPYTRDHYSRFYHVLETMCLRDNPTISKVKKGGKLVVSRGIYREDRHQSPFCIRSIAPAAFNALFKAARDHDLPLVLSYSPHEAGDGTHPRAVSMEQLIDLAGTHYKRVEPCLIEGSSHNKLNRNDLKLKTRDHAEILLKCFR